MRVPTALRGAVYVTAFVGLFAALVRGARALDPRFGFVLPRVPTVLAAALVAGGGALGLWCAVLFVLRGRGTPAPFDPPTRFVAVGPFRWVRNPMYVGGLALLLGAALWLRSPGVLLFAGVAALASHLFVLLYEEPALSRSFGDGYAEYRRRVRRWLPRVPGRNMP